MYKPVFVKKCAHGPRFYPRRWLTARLTRREQRVTVLEREQQEAEHERRLEEEARRAKGQGT